MSDTDNDTGDERSTRRAKRKSAKYVARNSVQVHTADGYVEFADGDEITVTPDDASLRAWLRRGDVEEVA